MKRTGAYQAELIIGTGVLVLLILLAFVRVTGSGVAAREECCHQYVRDLNEAIVRFKDETGDDVAQLSELAQSAFYPDTIPSCPVTGERFQIDPKSRQIHHAHQ